MAAESNTSFNLFLVLGIGFIGFACLHEVTRFRLRRGKTVKGHIVGEIAEGPGGELHPQVEFMDDGVVRRFTSGYGGFRPQIGAEVKVIIPAKRPPEIASIRYRLMFTIMPLLFGIGALICGLVASGK